MDAYSQRKRILGYIQTHGSITSYQAMKDLHIMSPRKRLSEINRVTPLKKAVEYSVTYVEGRKRICRFVRYSL